MRYDRTYWRMVGLALLPALAVSVAVVLIGRIVNASDSTTDRISQILFFPTFFGACYYFRNRGSTRTS